MPIILNAKKIRTCKRKLNTCKNPLNHHTRQVMSLVIPHLQGKNAVRTYHLATRNARAIPKTAPKGLQAIKNQIMKNVPKPKRPQGPRLNWNYRATLNAAVNLNRQLNSRIPANRNRLAQRWQAALFRPKSKRGHTYANNVEYVCNGSRYAPGGVNLRNLRNAYHFMSETNRQNGCNTRRNIANRIR